MRRISPVFLVLAALLPAAALLAATVTRSSRPVRLLRTWEETIKADDGERVRKVDVIVDYASGQAWQRFTGPSGEPLGGLAVALGSPAPSPEEIAEAFRVVRKSRELSLIFRRFPDLVLEGGFILQEPPGRPCGPQTRCLRIFLLSSDRAGTIRQVVVDVSRLRLAYPIYSPPQRSTE